MHAKQNRPARDFRAVQGSISDPRVTYELARFYRRAVAEAMAAAIPGQWERRADQLDAARPRPGDYLGRSTPEGRAALDRQLAQDAERCRRHAQLLRDNPHPLLEAMEQDIRRMIGMGAVA